MASQLTLFMTILGVSMLLVSLQVSGAEIENHTRWNNLLDVCVYFYNVAPGVTGHCYVPEDMCIIERHNPNWYRNVDELECTWLLPGEVNELPVLSVDEVSVREGELVDLSGICTDPEGGEVTLEFSGTMDGPLWQTDFEDAGNYKQAVTCTDRERESVSENFWIRVEDVNRPPVFIRPA